jgi:hypothetical protein
MNKVIEVDFLPRETNAAFSSPGILVPYGNTEALKVAQELDAKAEALLASCGEEFQKSKTEKGATGPRQWQRKIPRTCYRREQVIVDTLVKEQIWITKR